MTNKKTIYNRLVDMIVEVANIHSQTQRSVYHETTEQEQQILDTINTLIDGGMVELYPLKALLTASNNWSTFLIVRIGFFQDILLEGIEQGCLEPENSLAWEWLEVAAQNNDPTDFMYDTERYYDILATAAEEGNSIALDIMNTIWEPENIIEED